MRRDYIAAQKIQKSKGGGLAAGFSSSNQIMGVRKTTDFLEKTTWILAATIIILSIFTAKYTASHSQGPQPQVEVQQPAPLSPGVAPDVTPTMPMPSPALPNQEGAQQQEQSQTNSQPTE